MQPPGSTQRSPRQQLSGAGQPPSAYPQSQIGVPVALGSTQRPRQILSLQHICAYGNKGQYSTPQALPWLMMGRVSFSRRLPTERQMGLSGPTQAPPAREPQQRSGHGQPPSRMEPQTQRSPLHIPLQRFPPQHALTPTNVPTSSQLADGGSLTDRSGAPVSLPTVTTAPFATGARSPGGTGLPMAALGSEEGPPAFASPRPSPEGSTSAARPPQQPSSKKDVIQRTRMGYHTTDLICCGVAKLVPRTHALVGLRESAMAATRRRTPSS